MIMIAIMGAVASTFWLFSGLDHPKQLFDGMRIGVRAFIAFSSAIYLLIAVRAGLDPGETAGRLMFVAGGFIAVFLIVVFDLLFVDQIIDYIVLNPGKFGFRPWQNW